MASRPRPLRRPIPEETPRKPRLYPNFALGWRRMRLFITILMCSQACLAAMTDQDIADMFNGISRHAARIEPMLQQVRTDEWLAKGAPETYVAQRNSAMQQLQTIETEMSGLALHPEGMQDGMKALFRVQAFHEALESLMAGLRKYQNPPLADLIEAVAAEDRGDIDRLQEYLLGLAGEKERQFEVVDREAQRCRANLSRQPAIHK